MLEFQEKKKLKKFFYSKSTLAIVAVLVVLVGKATWGVHEKQRVSEENLVRAQENFMKLKEREKFLNAEIGKLSSTEGTEQEIRKKFSVVKEGENVAVIVDDTDGDEMERLVKKPSVWKRITDWFK